MVVKNAKKARVVWVEVFWIRRIQKAGTDTTRETQPGYRNGDQERRRSEKANKRYV
jgi:hypothetical protein